MIKIIVLLLCASVLVTLIESYQKSLVIPITVCAGCIVFLIVFETLKGTVTQIEKLSEQVGLEFTYVKVLMKMLGIAYLCEFSSSVCRDSGQTSFAAKIDMAGKLLILSQSLPVFNELLKIIRAILPH